MKLDTYFSHIKCCPETGQWVFAIYTRSGICTACGHDNDSTISHYEKVVGKWLRPSVTEWLKGERATFVPKGELT